MRRIRNSSGNLAIARKGVTAKVKHKKRNANSPVDRIKYSAGFAPNASLKAPHTK